MKKIIILLIVAAAITACDKQKSINGVVNNTGLIAADGCGWLIVINGEFYKPTNLDSEYKVNGLNITFDFKKLNSTSICGNQVDDDGIQEIKILKIH